MALGVAGRTISLCFLAALFEGLDIQSMGVAAPHVARMLNIGPQRMGILLSASVFGLMIGAAWGGRASDRYGRPVVLTLSLALFGAFSLITPLAASLNTMLGVRLLAGLGLGGTLPTLIALATDVAPPRHRVSLLSLVYGGLPLGGAVAGVIASRSGADAWQGVFVVGGVGPLALAPFLYVGLAATSVTGAGKESVIRNLFGQNLRTTLLLWLAFFFTLLAVYLLLNWLPTLMATRIGVGAAGATISLNMGAVAGSLVLGRLSDRRPARGVLLVTYLGMLAALPILIVTPGGWALTACFFAGFFIIGGQLVLYALAPTVYADGSRGAGIGAAVAAGRAGSVAGPLVGGLALSAGLSSANLPAIMAPGLIVAFVAASAVLKAVRASRGSVVG